MLTLGELHRLGLLYLQKGKWGDRQILTEEWVMESTSKQGDNDKDEYGYGYLFWGGSRNSFRADGKYSQLSIICREKNAVITVSAECRKGKELMDTIFENLYSQL